ncbi:unnamed protein product [Moneuplotes crassus]|uniref:Uncharacterized protein n=1 Tax=Euplotes crassus TaxID=5936 RepID=A0AAD1XUM8_EUPCR|nr:unnamed protein product [Moneuplotes crassus]
MEDVRTTEIALNNELTDLGRNLKNSIFERIHNIPDFFDLYNNVELFCQNKKDLNFMKSIGKLKVPDFLEYQINRMILDKVTIRCFINTSFTSKTELAFLSNRPSWLENFNKSAKEIYQILPRVLNAISIDRFQINHKHFVRVFSLCRDKSDLRFFYCKLPLEIIPNLSKSFPTCNIKELRFHACGTPKLGDWSNNPQLLDNLINSLSQCQNLVDSLTCLSLTNNNLDLNEVEQIFMKYKLDKTLLKI